MSADNPVERLDSFRNKRIFLVCGLDEDINETFVRNGQREFRGLLAGQASRTSGTSCPVRTSCGATCSSATSTA